MANNGGVMLSNRTVRAHEVRIEFEQGEAGLIFAISPDLRGLLVAERTREEVEAAIPQAIMDLYAACGEAVVVTRMDTHEAADNESWVAFPSEVARMALSRETRHSD